MPGSKKPGGSKKATGSKKSTGSKNPTGARKTTGSKKASASKSSPGTKKAVATKRAARGAAVAAAPISFASQIRPLFRTIDVQCMRGRGVFLKSYDYMKVPDNAREVLEKLQPDAEPRMPYGGPYWTDANIQLLKDWIDEGLNP